MVNDILPFAHDSSVAIAPLSLSVECITGICDGQRNTAEEGMKSSDIASREALADNRRRNVGTNICNTVPG